MIRELIGLQSIPYERAVLCQDCQHVSDSARYCNRCGSLALHLISKWIDRHTHVWVCDAHTGSYSARYAYCACGKSAIIGNGAIQHIG